jgi:hypothetical protein
VRLPITVTACVLSIAGCGSSIPTQPSATHIWSTPGAVATINNYSVTFTADAACTSLPAHLQSRTYPATSEAGPIRLGGAVFASYEGYGPMNLILLAVFGDHAQAWFQDGPIIEWVTPESTLMIEGHAAGPIGGSTIDIPVSATYLFCPKTRTDGPGCAVPFIRCESTRHRLTITPLTGSGL